MNQKFITRPNTQRLDDDSFGDDNVAVDDIDNDDNLNEWRKDSCPLVTFLAITLEIFVEESRKKKIRKNGGDHISKFSDREVTKMSRWKSARLLSIVLFTRVYSYASEDHLSQLQLSM